MLTFPLFFAYGALFEEEVNGETGVLVTLDVFVVTDDLFFKGVDLREEERRTGEEDASEDVPFSDLADTRTWMGGIDRSRDEGFCGGILHCFHRGCIGLYSID